MRRRDRFHQQHVGHEPDGRVGAPRRERGKRERDRRQAQGRSAALAGIDGSALGTSLPIAENVSVFIRMSPTNRAMFGTIRTMKMRGGERGEPRGGVFDPAQRPGEVQRQDRVALVPADNFRRLGHAEEEQEEATSRRSSLRRSPASTLFALGDLPGEDRGEGQLDQRVERVQPGEDQRRPPWRPSAGRSPRCRAGSPRRGTTWPRPRPRRGPS